MTPQERKVMEQALEFIERSSTYLPTNFDREGLSIHAALRQCLEQCHHGVDDDACKECYEPPDDNEARYKSVIDDVRKLWNDKRKREQQPAIVERAEESFDAAKQRGWVGLTDEEIYACDPQEECWNIDDVYKNIEAKLRIKNT